MVLHHDHHHIPQSSQSPSSPSISWADISVRAFGGGPGLSEQSRTESICTLGMKIEEYDIRKISYQRMTTLIIWPAAFCTYPGALCVILRRENDWRVFVFRSSTSTGNRANIPGIRVYVLYSHSPLLPILLMLLRQQQQQQNGGIGNRRRVRTAR